MSLGLWLLTSCQLAPAVSVRKLAIHRDSMDQTGLDVSRLIASLGVTWSTPAEWDALPIRTTALYSHQQFRSPSFSTGVGVAHIKLPLPLPAETVIWFAKNEYLKRSKEKGGRLIGEWTDALGRKWFEAENSKYHVKGYTLARGNEAWIIYTGWRADRQLKPEEVALAGRSVESIVPTN